MWFTTEEVLLQPDFEVYAVDEHALNQAWAQLYEVSIEIANAGCPSLLGFAANHCLYMAAIQRWVGEKWQDVPGELHIPKSATAQAALTALSHAQNATASSSVLPGEITPPRPILSPTTAVDLDVALEALGGTTIEDEPSGPPTRAYWQSNQAQSQLTPSFESDDAPLAPAKHTYPQETIGLLYVCTGRMPNELTLGLTLLPPFRGRGYASQALTLALRWAFDHLQCHRVQALVMAGPHAADAEALFARHGFAHEGTLRRAALSQNAWRDVTCVALLDTEWCLGVGRKEAQSRWDVLLSRHQTEVERLLEWEAKMAATKSQEEVDRSPEDKGKGKLKRTASMETVRDTPSLCSTSETEQTPSEDERESSCAWGSPLPSPPPSQSPSPSALRISNPDISELADLLGALPPCAPPQNGTSSTTVPSPSSSGHSISGAPPGLTREALASLADASEQPYRSPPDLDSDWERASVVSRSESSSFSSVAYDAISVPDRERSSSPTSSLLSWSDIETSSLGSSSARVRAAAPELAGSSRKRLRRL